MKIARNYTVGQGTTPPITGSTGSDIITLRLNISNVTTPVIDTADFKYNKRMAFQVSFDDSYKTHYTHVLPFFTGGLSSDGNTYPGLKYSDGTGKMIPFHATIVMIAGAVREISGEVGAVQYSWDNALEMVNRGFGFSNHTYYHGGSPTGWDRYDDVRKADQLMYDKTGYRMMIGVTPAADVGNMYTFKNLGYWCHNATVNEGNSDITFYGGWVGAADMPKILQYCVLDRPYFGDDFNTEQLNSMKGYIDDIYDYSFEEKVCGNIATHSGGGGQFNSMYEYLLTKEPNSLWVPSCQEFFEYFKVKDQAEISVARTGNTMTITIDQTNLEPNIRDRGMSLLLSGCTISSISSIDGADEVTFNSSTGLINIYKNDASKTIDPASEIPPARITSLVASGNNVNITYDRPVSQTLTAGYSISGKSVTGITGSGTNWVLSFNSTVSAGNTMTYESNKGNAVTLVSNGKKVCDYINYPIS